MKTLLTALLFLSFTILTAQNKEYLHGVNTQNNAKQIMQLQIKAANFDVKKLESFEKNVATTYNVTFKNPNGKIIATYNSFGIILKTIEEYKNVKMEKIPALRAAFTKDGTVTAANASTINDGGAALVLMSSEKAKELNITPIAKIKSFADAAHEPEWFTTAPAKALPKALAKANISINDVDYFELNEAFSIVGLANMKILEITDDKVNVNGGAVSLGHPLGVSGARIVIALTSILKQNNAKIGAAAICNGGGGASAMIIERV